MLSQMYLEKGAPYSFPERMRGLGRFQTPTADQVTRMSGKTARARTKLSSPMRVLHEQGILGNPWEIIDIGCGKGTDADHLGFGAAWDPVHRDVDPHSAFRMGTMIYVLNTLPPTARLTAVQDAYENFLYDGAPLYAAVRDDVSGARITNSGTYQEEVRLDFILEPILEFFHVAFLPKMSRRGQWLMYLIHKL